MALTGSAEFEAWWRQGTLKEETRRDVGDHVKAMVMDAWDMGRRTNCPASPDPQQTLISVLFDRFDRLARDVSELKARAQK